MVTVNLVKCKDHSYWYGSKSVEDGLLWELTRIFLENVAINVLEFLENNLGKRRTYNSFYLHISDENPNKIILGLEWELREEEQPSETAIDRDNLIDILKNWLEYKSKGADEIILTNNNGKVDISAKFFEKK